MLSLHLATVTAMAPSDAFNETQIATVKLLVREYYLNFTMFRSSLERNTVYGGLPEGSVHYQFPSVRSSSSIQQTDREESTCPALY